MAVIQMNTMNPRTSGLMNGAYAGRPARNRLKILARCGRNIFRGMQFGRPGARQTVSAQSCYGRSDVVQFSNARGEFDLVTETSYAQSANRLRWFFVPLTDQRRWGDGEIEVRLRLGLRLEGEVPPLVPVVSKPCLLSPYFNSSRFFSCSPWIRGGSYRAGNGISVRSRQAHF